MNTYTATDLTGELNVEKQIALHHANNLPRSRLPLASKGSKFTHSAYRQVFLLLLQATVSILASHHIHK